MSKKRSSKRSETLIPSDELFFNVNAPTILLPDMEIERLARSQELKDMERENMKRRAKQLDAQYYLDVLRFVDPEKIVYDDGKFMYIGDRNMTIQNQYSYDYYNPKLTQGQSVTISMSALYDVRTGEKNYGKVL